MADSVLPGPNLPDQLMRAPQNVPPAHFSDMASGINDEATLRAGRKDILKFRLRPRRLYDMSTVEDTLDEVDRRCYRGRDCIRSSLKLA